ncbi:hypothetical protein DWUX_791 [Desulfovibrio diazotrophicus]|nr:hypothetical protein DWUX_791 [Desulfovibrio diazotrophicus]
MKHFLCQDFFAGQAWPCRTRRPQGLPCRGCGVGFVLMDRGTEIG